jgi:hypothetical protein
MTSRERVQRCVNFDNPHRPPRDLWMLPVAELEHGSDAISALNNVVELITGRSCIFFSEAVKKVGIGCIAAEFWPGQGATKEHTPRGSVTEEPRSSGQNSAQPEGREENRASGGVALSLKPHAGIRLVRALPSALFSSRAAYPYFFHSFLISCSGEASRFQCLSPGNGLPTAKRAA